MKLVLLPGLDGTGLLFKPFIDSLPGHIDTQVIAYPTEQKLGYQELVEWVATQLPEGEEFILLGESFSGPIACEVACRKPLNLKLVILVATFLQSPRPVISQLSRFLPLSFLFSLPVPEHVLNTWLFDQTTDPQVLDLFAQVIRKVPNDMLAFRLAEIARLKNRIESCAVPALYIQARQDKLVPPACLAAFEEVFGDIRICLVDGPHFILQSRPEICAEIIAREVLQ